MALQAAPVSQKSSGFKSHFKFMGMGHGAAFRHSEAKDVGFVGGIFVPDACFVSSIKPSRSGVILLQSPFSNGHPERVTPIAILVAATMAQRGS